MSGVMLTDEERREALMKFAGELYESTRTLFHTYQFDTGQDLEVSLPSWDETPMNRRLLWVRSTVDHAKTPLVRGLIFVMAEGVDS